MSEQPSNTMIRVGLDNLVRALSDQTTEAPGDLAEIATLLRGGARCGLVSNMASIADTMDDACTALLRAGVKIRTLFGPEHGSRGAAEAGEAVTSGSDPSTGLPVHSLYGSINRPTPEMLESLDLVIYDLQDVGARFFTYTWTLSYVIEACAEAGIPVVILDRPNPLGGLLIDGPLLEQGLETFVGRYPIPTCHGMTSGELGRLFAGQFTPGARVLVAGMSGWSRRDRWPISRPWAAPSPNIPTAATTWIYPATCLLEGTNVSEGRGTPLPFRSFGAPWVDPIRLAHTLNERTTSRWRPFYFTPASSKHNGALCGGVEWYPPADPHDLDHFRPARLGVELVSVLREIGPSDFEWLISPSGRSHFDRLVGQRDIRTRLSAGENPAAITAGWDAAAAEFRNIRSPYLCYE